MPSNVISRKLKIELLNRDEGEPLLGAAKRSNYRLKINFSANKSVIDPSAVQCWHRPLPEEKPVDLNSNVQVSNSSQKNSDWTDKYVRIYSAFSTFTCWNSLSLNKGSKGSNPYNTCNHKWDSFFGVSGKECLHTVRILHTVIWNQGVMAGDETAESCNSSDNTWSYWPFSWCAHWARQSTNLIPNYGIFISVFCRDL